jgi:Tfp pilus assembly protein PilO
MTYLVATKTFEFKIKSSFPKQLTKVFLLVDLLNNLDELAEDKDQTLKNLPKKKYLITPKSVLSRCLEK